MTDPLTIALCRDLIRHVYTLQGMDFIESELAYYKAFEARRFPAPAPAPVPAPPAPVPAPPAPVPAPPAPVPAPPAPVPAPVPPPAVILHTITPPPLPIRPNPLCTVKKEETEVVVVASVPAVVVAEAAAGAGAGAGAVAENKVIVAPVVEKTRYKRTELPDEQRCVDVTARGTRCTLGRHEESDYCVRHMKKHSS
jgi:hypothetical protein